MSTQLNLFESHAQPAGGLPGVPGLLYRPGFVDRQTHRRLLQAIDDRPWIDDLKRRVQHYGYRYDYKARRIAPSMFVGPLPPFAVQLGERMLSEGLVEQLPDQLIANEYLPGQGIAPHVDCEPCFHGTIVTISLGTVYEMEFTNIHDESVVAMDLDVGSALVLAGEARYHWKHGIRPRKTDHGRKRGRRVSLTFRNVIVDDE